MASLIMHYIIGQNLVDNFDCNHNDFILGNLLPDAHDGTTGGNLHAHFSHIIDENHFITSEIDFSGFMKKYSAHSDKKIILGYYCHLLSDYMWMHMQKPNQQVNCGKNKDEVFALRKRLHEDYSKLNKLLTDYYRLLKPRALIVPEELVIMEIDKNNIKKILDRLSQDFDSNAVGDLHVITFDFVLDYINQATTFCVDTLQAL